MAAVGAKDGLGTKFVSGSGIGDGLDAFDDVQEFAVLHRLIRPGLTVRTESDALGAADPRILSALTIATNNSPTSVAAKHVGVYELLVRRERQTEDIFKRADFTAIERNELLLAAHGAKRKVPAVGTEAQISPVDLVVGH